MSADAWLTLTEAAAEARVHPTTLRRLIRRKKLRCARVGDGPRSPIRLKGSWVEEAFLANAEPREVKSELRRAG